MFLSVLNSGFTFFQHIEFRSSVGVVFFLVLHQFQPEYHVIILSLLTNFVTRRELISHEKG